MSCNGCRVLRKGCSDTCILRASLLCIDSAEAQGHATVFVAKFFGRAGMISLISAVEESQRPAVFQSLLYEACGRTLNPVYGAVGLLWSGNWAVCQAAVETVLKGGSLKPLSTVFGGGNFLTPQPSNNNASVSVSPFNKRLLPQKLESVQTLEEICNKQQRGKKRRKECSPASLDQLGVKNVPLHSAPAPPPSIRPCSISFDAEQEKSEQHRTTSQDHHHCHIPVVVAVREASSSPAPRKMKSEPVNLVAPVPRRIKPIMPPSSSSQSSAAVAEPNPSSATGFDQQQQKHHEADGMDCALPTAQTCSAMAEEDRLLNLSLTLALDDASKPHVSCGNKKKNRVWSPQCSFSEGSVTTSLDSELSAIRSSCSKEAAGHGQRLLLLKLL